MSVLEWKSFKFFKLETIDNNAKYKNIINSVTAHCGNSSYKIFCSVRGVVYIFLADWECISFQATHNPIIACTITDESDLLVIIEQNASECLIKCYSVLKLLDRKPVAPLCSSSLDKNCKVSTVKVCSIIDSQVWIAVGLERGIILLYKASLSRNVLACFKTLQVCLNPIKGIAFVYRGVGDIKMCVCTDIGVFYYNLSVENCNETKQVVDDVVESANCCTVMPADESNGEQYFVVGKTDALYCYTSEGRGPCFAINGAKQLIKWFGKHIYVVLKVNGPSTADQKPEFRSQLIIINIDNNMIVFNEVLLEVACIFPALYQTKCLIFMKDGTIFTLRDQGIAYKLHLLYEKNLYDVALKLVEEQNVHPSVIANVNLRYADYLLQRGDVAASVKMFIRTIGYVSPFRVISRLLNIRYNEYITQYLRVLIDTGHGYNECRSLHQNCRRRMDLPIAINHIFSKLTYNFNFDTIPIEQTKITGILSSLLDDSNGVNKSVTDTDDGILDISPHYEHWIVSNWPLNAVEILKDIIADESLHSLQSRDKFIQIFLSLLFSNKDCVLDVISSIYSDHNPNAGVNLIWAEILMQMWKSRSVDANTVLDFFRKQKLLMNEDVHIICHTHKFWPVVKMVHDGNELDALAMPWAHACEISPLSRNDIGTSSKSFSHQMLMQTLRKEYLNTNHSSAVFQQVVSNIFHHNPHNMLTVIQKLASSAPFNICHINSVLTKEVIMKRLALQRYHDIPELERKLLQIKALLNGYGNSPIEFRNSSCDACKQSLKQPIIYYSCQHAYHKECIVSYSESNSCLVCKNSMLKQNTDTEKIAKKTAGVGQSSTFRHISEKLTVSLCRGLQLGSSSSTAAKSSFSDAGGIRDKPPTISKDPFEEIAEVDGSTMFKAISTKAIPASSAVGVRDKARIKSTNPFEDANSNPFM